MTIDIIIVALYIIFIFWQAKSTHKSSDNCVSLLESKFLAGRSLSFSDSLFSIIATEVSALTFLGIPSFAYTKDFSFVQIYMGAFFGRVIIAYFFLPAVYGKGLTIYEVMGENGTLGGKRLISLFYALNKFLAVGVRFFSGSIIIATFFNLSIVWALIVIAILTLFYTSFGGLKAVVKTDKSQLFILVLGGVLAHFLIPDIVNIPWADLMDAAATANKTAIFVNWEVFMTGVIGGILFDMSTHGVDQDFVQRLTGNKSLASAQKAIILSSFVSISIGLLFLSIGALLWANYQQAPLPEGVKPDQLFAYFITNFFPSGVRGLMVAGVLAATMSTLDSTINALSATFYNDIQNKKEKDFKGSFWKDSVIVTTLLTVVAIVASQSSGMLILGLKITSWTCGSLVCLFVGTTLFKWGRLTALNVFVVYSLGIAMVYLNTYHFKFAWQWNVYLAFGLGLLYLKLISIKR